MPLHMFPALRAQLIGINDTAHYHTRTHTFLEGTHLTAADRQCHLWS